MLVKHSKKDFTQNCCNRGEGEKELNQDMAKTTDYNQSEEGRVSGWNITKMNFIRYQGQTDSWLTGLTEFLLKAGQGLRYQGWVGGQET